MEVIDPESGNEPLLAALSLAAIKLRLQEGAMVLDTRPARVFYSGHIPGSLQIGLGSEFEACARAVVEFGRDVILVAEDDRAAEEARVRLTRAGIDRVPGKLADGITGWMRAGLPLAETREISVCELSEEMARNPKLSVVDVRGPAEFEESHVPGALLRPLNELRTGMLSLDRERLTAVQCQSGYRSAIACSLLAAHGFKRVMAVSGGFDAWAGAGLPAVRRRADAARAAGGIVP